LWRMTTRPPVRLGEWRVHHDFSALPRLDPAGMQVRTVREYWDGLFSGILEYQGEWYWYETFFGEDRDVVPEARRFVLAEVPEAVVLEELEWERVFRASGVSVSPERWHAEVYGPYLASGVPELGEALLIGWCFLMAGERAQ